jgi:hypothetical protein
VVHAETIRVELIAAPVILAWLAARGWKTEHAMWPLRPPFRSLIARFLIATLIFVGLPLLSYSIVLGFVRSLELHDPPYLVIFGYAVAVIVSGALIWIGKRDAARLVLDFLGLSRATWFEKTRVGIYWLMSVAVLAYAIWPEELDVDILCKDARRAYTDMFGGVPESLKGTRYACSTIPQGQGWAVTITIIPSENSGIRSPGLRFRATLYSNGESRGIELLPSDPAKG